MKNQKPIFAFLLAFFAACRLFGISFQGLDLSDDDRLLFRADFESQHALFVSRLGDLSLQQVTAFPERLELVENNRTIVAHNRFGAVKIPVSGGLPAPVSGFPSFAAGDVPLKGRLQEFAASADGRWILYVEPTSPAYGNLLLTETTSGGAAGGTAGGIKRIVSERVELPADDFPARWSPDSRLFVYSKNGRLYYFPILQDSAPIADERFRQIGPGGITAVLWGQQRDFFYLQGNTLYRIANPALFTRTIYGDFLSIGSAVGFLPIDFDSNFDRYWLAPDAGSILINKNGKGIFYFLLGEKQTAGAILPHTVIPRGAGNLNVLWPASGPPSGNPSGHLTVIAPMPGGTAVWRFDADGKASVLKNNPASSRGVLSPDGTRAVFWGETGVELWDYINWRLIQRLIREPIVSCAWISNTELVMGSGNLIEGITIPDRGTPRRRLICLSGAERFGFEEENNVTRNALRILAKSGADWYVTDGKNPWLPINNPKLRSAVLTSAYYRAYLDQQSTGPYKNIPMVRYTSTTGTVSL
ncbi:MAG: hypothetical protein LBH43_15210, partial [Treponema sp.]|nr:hypothetical protein [Treponema sp.]